MLGWDLRKSRICFWDGRMIFKRRRSASWNVIDPFMASRVRRATSCPLPQNLANSSMPSSRMTVESTSKQTTCERLMTSAASTPFFVLSVASVEFVMVRKLAGVVPLLMVIFLVSSGAPFARDALDAIVLADVTLSVALAEMATKLIKDVFNLHRRRRRKRLSNSRNGGKMIRDEMEERTSSHSLWPNANELWWCRNWLKWFKCMC